MISNKLFQKTKIHIMKSTFLKFTAPIGLGLGLFIITFFASSYTGCEKEKTTTTSTSTGCGTQMGCCPATGCGRGYLLSCDGRCYTTRADADAAARAQRCYSYSSRQCY